MPTLSTLAPDASVDEIMLCVDRDGAVILRDVLSETEVAQIESELGPYWDATPQCTDPFSGTRTRRMGALLARSAQCREMALNEKAMGVCDRVLLKNCERYQIQVTQAIGIGPGEASQPLHTDRLAWQSPLLLQIEPQVTCMWAVTDFTRENGATAVIPGSGSWPDDRRVTPDDIAYAEMQRGSVLIYASSVLHGGSANDSDQERMGLLIQYSLGWLRQAENQYLCCPPEMARDFDPELRRLLGYSMPTFAIGYYSPPLPAGAGVEVVSVEHAVSADVSAQTMGGVEMLQKAMAKAGADSAETFGKGRTGAA